MGATASAMFAGVRSERLRSLTLLEGLGPPAVRFESAPDRFKSWFNSTARVAKRSGRTRLEGLPDALRRMRVQNSKLDDALGAFLADKGSRVIDAEGGREWRFDPRHRTTSPMPFRPEMFKAFLGGVRVPTLVLLGQKGYRLPADEENARLAAIPDAMSREIPDVGHMLHWFAPEEVSSAIVGQLTRVDASAAATS